VLLPMFNIFLPGLRIGLRGNAVREAGKPRRLEFCGSLDVPDDLRENVCRPCGVCGLTFLSPLPGLARRLRCYPQLTLWAAFFRVYAA